MVIIRRKQTKITLKESTQMRLQECKGCGSWSDAIDSLFGVIEAQKKIIKELKHDKESSDKSVFE